MANKTLFALMFLCSYALLRRRHLYNCREVSTNQLLFMQNKPNFQNDQMNVSNIITSNYKNYIPLAGQKNKPNSNPNKACPERSRMGQFPKYQNERKIGCIHISKKYNVLIRKVLDSQTYFVVKNRLH